MAGGPAELANRLGLLGLELFQEFPEGRAGQAKDDPPTFHLDLESVPGVDPKRFSHFQRQSDPVLAVNLDAGHASILSKSRARRTPGPYPSGAP